MITSSACATTRTSSTRSVSLREREVVHYQRFGEALRLVQDDLNSKNFYAIIRNLICKKVYLCSKTVGSRSCGLRHHKAQGRGVRHHRLCAAGQISAGCAFAAACFCLSKPGARSVTACGCQAPAIFAEGIAPRFPAFNQLFENLTVRLEVLCKSTMACG